MVIVHGSNPRQFHRFLKSICLHDKINASIKSDELQSVGVKRYIMSDHIIKIIPTNCTYSVTKERADCILKFLRSKIKADNIQASIYATSAFVDCGSNLETIVCPHCGAQLDFGWWGESMDIASEEGFKDLSVIMPCCSKESTLNDLHYDLPCGFACIEFDILNPSADFGDEILSTIEELIGSQVRMIHAHI